MPTYTPQHIANFFLSKAEEEGLPVTQLKLIKLVYIAYGWVLALTNQRLFRERVQAWKHGPVVPTLYHEFKKFGSSPITEKSWQMDADTKDIIFPEIPKDDVETIAILEKVWAAYKRFRGWDLRQKTHEPNSPWEKVYEDGVFDIPLEDDDIRNHYLERIRRYLEPGRRAAS